MTQGETNQQTALVRAQRHARDAKVTHMHYTHTHTQTACFGCAKGLGMCWYIRGTGLSTQTYFHGTVQGTNTVPATTFPCTRPGGVRLGKIEKIAIDSSRRVIMSVCLRVCVGVCVKERSELQQLQFTVPEETEQNAPR